MLSRLALYAGFSGCIFIALPIAAGRDYLMHPAPWVGFLIGVLTLASQPPLTPAELVADASDRRSALTILLAVIATNLVSVIQFCASPAETAGPSAVLVGTGIAIAAAGMALRLWSIRTLGPLFTSTVSVQAGQPTVAAGPYRAMRHPSYTGTILTTVGTAIAFGSVLGMLLVLLLVLPAYLYRIRVEEKELLEFLEGYAAYKESTPALIPTWTPRQV